MKKQNFFISIYLFSSCFCYASDPGLNWYPFNDQFSQPHEEYENAVFDDSGRPVPPQGVRMLNGNPSGDNLRGYQQTNDQPYAVKNKNNYQQNNDQSNKSQGNNSQGDKYQPNNSQGNNSQGNNSQRNNDQTSNSQGSQRNDNQIAQRNTNPNRNDWTNTSNRNYSNRNYSSESAPRTNPRWYKDSNARKAYLRGDRDYRRNPQSRNYSS